MYGRRVQSPSAIQGLDVWGWKFSFVLWYPSVPLTIATNNTEDKQILRKINGLIKDIQWHPHEGLGKPEPLKYDLAGIWSRRIDREHRLVYKVTDNEIFIYSCRYHYDH